MNKLILSLIAIFCFSSLLAQEADTTVMYAYGTFHSTRLINGHSVENLGKNVLDFRIQHRFGKLNMGGYQMFGLDNASMHWRLDYGITNWLMVGVGRGSFQKTYDGFFKARILRQSSGSRNMPVTLNWVSSVAIKAVKFDDTTRINYFTSRLYYSHQLIIGRKFTPGFSAQLMPTYVHRNLVTYNSEPNDLFALGMAARLKLTHMLSVTAEYYYQIPPYKLKNTTNSLAIGFDIETGGHVFQLHVTNSDGMSERTFVTETNGKWLKGDILFGFNISRLFEVGKKK